VAYEKQTRVAIYARVSTSDKDQDPTTQLLPVLEFAAAQGWQTAGEYVDHASATDLRGRVAWRDLLTQASRRKLDCILVWKLDRAFRSVAHMAQTVEQLRRWGVGLRSYSEPWLDTSGTSPVGDLMLNILASFAQFERALIAERVKAGMARAKKQGKHVGRPAVLNGNFEALRPAIEAGTLSRSAAARRLGVTLSAVSKALKKGSDNGGAETRITHRAVGSH
jgi:DNA invertase Pin-like site-specific DNA recombinase